MMLLLGDRTQEKVAMRMSTHLRKQSRYNGFTLVEILVALGIAAISLTASLKATSSMLNSNEELRMRLLATWSAENRLATIRLEKQWPDVGNTEFACPQANFELKCKQKIRERCKLTIVQLNTHPTAG